MRRTAYVDGAEINLDDKQTEIIRAGHGSFEQQIEGAEGYSESQFSEMTDNLARDLGMTKSPTIQIVFRKQLHDLLRVKGNQKAYWDKVNGLLTRIAEKNGLVVLVNFLELLELLPSQPTDLNKLDILVDKLLTLSPERPDRGIRMTITHLLRANVNNVDLAVWLVEVIDAAGAHMIETVLSFRDQYNESPLLAYFFTEVAKLGSVDAVHRLAGLIHFFRDSREDIATGLLPVMQMIETGQKIQAEMTLRAMEEAFTSPGDFARTQAN